MCTYDDDREPTFESYKSVNGSFFDWKRQEYAITNDYCRDTKWERTFTCVDKNMMEREVSFRFAYFEDGDWMLDTENPIFK